MRSAILLFAFPLLIMNWVSPIVAFLWLIFLGEYSLLVTAAMAGFAATFGYVLAMIPAMVILLPAAFLVQKINPIIRFLGYLLLSVGGFWTYILMGAWTLYVFGYLPEIYIDRSLPHLLLAYGVSTGPFAYMASKEDPANVGTHFATLLNQLSSLLLLLLLYLTDLKILSVVMIFCLLICFGYALGLMSGLLSHLRQASEDSDGDT